MRGAKSIPDDSLGPSGLVMSVPDPTTTEVTAIITDVYMQVYTIMYPDQDIYAADDANDSSSLVDNNHVKGVLMSWLCNSINDRFFSGANGQGEYRFPSWDLPDKIVKKLELIKWNTVTLPIDNIRFGGSDHGDYEGVGY